jgi:tRNA(Arg) A34 adenosine deaminase TadA
VDESGLAEADRRHLRRCVDLAQEAREAGDAASAPSLVTKDGNPLQEERKRVVAGDRTRYPELALALGGGGAPDARRAGQATVYASGEHWLVCSAARARSGSDAWSTSTPRPNWSPTRLNDRPRQVLGRTTAREVFNIAAVALTA